MTAAAAAPVRLRSAATPLSEPQTTQPRSAALWKRTTASARLFFVLLALFPLMFYNYFRISTSSSDFGDSIETRRRNEISKSTTATFGPSLTEDDSKAEKRIRKRDNNGNTEFISFWGNQVGSTDVDTSKPFCVLWNVDTDAWWTHRPDWTVTLENTTHYCFGPMKDPDKAQFFRELYNIQFRGNCSLAVTVEQYNQGWGSDFRSVFQALSAARQSQQPSVMYLSAPWIYAVGPQTWINGTRQFVSEQAAATSACNSRDPQCYFLNLTSCPADANHVLQAHDLAATTTETTPIIMDSRQGGWILEYATRPQTWLRQRVYRYLAAQHLRLKSPCTVFHVRRADAVLTLEQYSNLTRRYHAIEEYINAAASLSLWNSSSRNSILLLTDDKNAVGEALHKYPHYNWVYLDRQRHKGAAGGFENQIPSGDPITEVVVILSELALAQHCDSIVHTESSFPYFLRPFMMTSAAAAAAGDKTITAVDMDDKLRETGQEVFTETHKFSLKISKPYDDTTTTAGAA